MKDKLLEDAFNECKFYNKLGGLDDDVIKDIAFKYKIKFKILKQKMEDYFNEST